MLLIIDNYDSFTYNLVQYFGELGAEVRVIRNDEMTVEQVAALAPAAIVISPGPGSPDKDSGISNDVLRVFSGRVPILGVCLGQQCMGHVFGGQVVRAPNGVMHGKVSPVYHNGRDLFAGLPSPLDCTRYHSLIVIEPLPDDLEATAHTADGELMAVRHKTHPTFGVQFHPESILTEHGKDMLANFLRLADAVAPSS
ncbi:MAG: aminodeoxychorismate/anthranilate synthase component II [Anaerolineae bacterium]|nr:aminodeoxychorismate/anthranilate synthase component II [Anaerolineae bacterium]